MIDNLLCVFIQTYARSFVVFVSISSAVYVSIVDRYTFWPIDFIYYHTQNLDRQYTHNLLCFILSRPPFYSVFYRSAFDIRQPKGPIIYLLLVPNSEQSKFR